MTTIDYHIPHSTQSLPKIKLAITDMMGREISVLVNEKRISGMHSIPFEWNSLTNGVYYIVINIEGIRSSQMQMIVN